MAEARLPGKPGTGREAEIAGRVLRHWHEAVPDDRMAHLVKDASRAFLRALQTRLAQHEVQLGHWVFLRILWQRDGFQRKRRAAPSSVAPPRGAGRRDAAALGALLTKRELSIEAGVMEPTTFVALRAMQALGYVTLEQVPGNRKNVYVRLAPAGRRLEQVLVPLACEVNAIAMAGLGEAEIATTRSSLLTMIGNLAREAQQG